MNVERNLDSTACNEIMTRRYPWVVEADKGVRFGIQVGAVRRRTGPMTMELYDEPARVIVEAGVLIEQLGFDGLFVFDHPSIMPDPWTCLSALALATEKVVLRIRRELCLLSASSAPRAYNFRP